jgi:hypothetical protein
MFYTGKIKKRSSSATGSLNKLRYKKSEPSPEYNNRSDVLSPLFTGILAKCKAAVV